MNDTQRNILSAGLVCAASASLVGGIFYRGAIDARNSGVRQTDLLAHGLVASREAKVDVPEQRYFSDLTVLLKRNYVDPIESEDKLAIGAVKGMISSLDDERSLFMAAPVYRAFVSSLRGKFEGIGATLVLSRKPQDPKAAGSRSTLDFLGRVPLVEVAYVVPGGPADRAGLKAGDVLESIDGRWIVNPTLGERFREVDAKVRSGQLPAQARTDLQNEMREKFGNSMMPVRAMERLSAGEEGQFELEWRRGAELLSGQVAKAVSYAAVNELSASGTMRISFIGGAPEALAKALKSGQEVTLDLRGQSQGDYRTMLACLELLVPAGEYGQIVKAKGPAMPVKVMKGVEKPVPIRLLVDGETKGLAEIFATVLRGQGAAKVQGGPTGGMPSLIERTALPDGSGFTLRVGDFRPAKGGRS